MTRKELFEVFRTAAECVYDGREAVALAWFLMENTASVDRAGFLMEPHAHVAVPSDLDRILSELKAGRPVQYIAGRCDFCGLEFVVREGVLIPRPETEELVAWVADDAHAYLEGSKTEEHAGVITGKTNRSAGVNTDGGCAEVAISVLDVCTGSGAIAVSLAKMLPGASIRATDISEEALEIAKENAGLNAAAVEFVTADALSDPEKWDGVWQCGTFDVIVSNPPYVPSRDLASMHINVREHEPHLALFVPDDDPLLFYRAIARSAGWLLAPGGRLYFEIYEQFADGLRELLVSSGFTDVVVRKDINGKNRMVRCLKK